MFHVSSIPHTLGMVGMLAAAGSCQTSSKSGVDGPPASGDSINIAQGLQTSTPMRTGKIAPAVALLAYADEPLSIVADHVEIPVTTINISCPTGDDSCEQFEQAHGRAPIPGHVLFCTATFIDELTIVTASHCIYPARWALGYVLLDHLEGAQITGDRASIPASRIARFSCLEHSVGRNSPSWDGSTDWAIVRLAPLGTGLDVHETLTLGVRSGPEAALVVQSHMLALPLLEHETEITSDPNALRFTNAGGGSGSPVLEHELIVGIVRGKSAQTGSCSPHNPWCWQAVTWSDRIKDAAPPREIHDTAAPKCTTKEER